MLNDTEIVACLASQYGGDRFDYTAETSGIYWSLKKGDGSIANPHLVMCRGSTTPEDWLRDFESEVGRVIPGWDSLGLMPDGFSRGLVDAMNAISDQIGGPAHLIFAGHSLGAAHAAELAAMFAHSDTISRVVLCGCPRPGTAQLAAWLPLGKTASYRNLNDPVCDVPIAFAPFLNWCPVTSYIQLSEQPGANDPWALLSAHHIQLYQAGIAKLYAAP